MTLEQVLHQLLLLTASYAHVVPKSSDSLEYLGFDETGTVPLLNDLEKLFRIDLHTEDAPIEMTLNQLADLIHSKMP